MLVPNVLLGAAMMLLTVLIHFVGLTLLSSMSKRTLLKRGQPSTNVHQGAIVLAVVFGLFALHTLEIWAFAAVYIWLGEFNTIEEAVYFSTSAFTTVGFGDLYLDEDWWLLSSFEAAIGFLLIGWSTAHLVTVIGFIRNFEQELEELREAWKERNRQV